MSHEEFFNRERFSCKYEEDDGKEELNGEDVEDVARKEERGGREREAQAARKVLTHRFHKIQIIMYIR